MLAGIIDAGHDVALVITGPYRRRSRGAGATPTPVGELAHARGISVSHHARDAIDADAELGIVVAFGQLIKKDVLDVLPLVNLHFSLLPRWRGAAPVERAILAGDTETGVCLMALEEGLDTGPVYATKRVEIGPDEKADELRVRLGVIGLDLLLERIAHGASSLGVPAAQVGDATYASKITQADLALDFNDGAMACHRVVRVGRAWTTFRSRRVIIESSRAHLYEGSERVVPGTILEGGVATSDGVLEVLELKSEGRATQTFSTWRRGARPLPGERFGH